MKYESAWYIRTRENSSKTYMCTYAADQHSSPQLENDLICTVLTSNNLTSSLLVRLTSNGNHVLLTENINLMLMHHSSLHAHNATQPKMSILLMSSDLTQLITSH